MVDKENFAKDINVPHKEQIMIDGVNVSKCKGIDLSLHPLVKCKFLKFKTSGGGIAGIWCSDHTKCNFKQLACKTQECEDLKLILQQSKDNNKSTLLLLAKKNEECEELKEDLKRYKGVLKDITVTKIDYLQESFANQIKADRYLKALTEIKEIAEPFCNACQEFEPEKKGSNCMYCNYGKILQKISEVEK